MKWSSAVLHPPPDVALIAFTVGLLLIYIELNRPGAIVPGLIGLTLALLAVAALLQFHLAPVGLALILSAAALLLLDLFRPTPPVVAASSALALCLGFFDLLPNSDPVRVHALTSILCGLVLAGATSILTRIARRARFNKAVD